MVNWRRVLWIGCFAYFFFCTGCFDRHRALACNPLVLSTCEPD